MAFIVQKHDTELKLTKIWEDILGTRPIRPDDNFFALGGTSLLATFLFARVAETFNIELSLSTLIEAPTIAQVAHILREGAGPLSNSPLVPMQPNGSRPPFFCVHGAGGNVLMYRDLARQLGHDQPFYGLQSQGLDGQQPVLTRIEDMASLYVGEIQRVQKHGPYFLGGYCMGGTIALEMAQQLVKCGERVALLALFDTLNWSRIPANSVRTKAYYQVQRLFFHAGNFLLLSFKDKVRFFQGKVRVLQSRSHVWRGFLLRRFTSTQRTRRSEASVLAQVWESNDSAALNYTPSVFCGDITDFRPMKQYKKHSGEHLKWGQLAHHGQSVVKLKVYPGGMLLEPFVKDLAAELRLAIDGAAIAYPDEPKRIVNAVMG